MPENTVIFQSANKISFLNRKVSWSQSLIQQNSKHIFNFNKLGEDTNETLLGVIVRFSFLLLVVPKTGCKSQRDNRSLHDC